MLVISEAKKYVEKNINYWKTNMIGISEDWEIELFKDSIHLPQWDDLLIKIHY